MKKEIKTTYYDRFKCIGGDCSLTCCQEWSIAVDDETHTKWKDIKAPHPNSNTLDKYVKEKEGAHIIELNEQKQCPFLNKQKLCDLVVNFGDEVLSTTCATFPRQIQEFEDRKEYTLVTCCPEVVDFINQEERISFTGNFLDGNSHGLIEIRSMMMGIMENKEFTIPKSVMMIFYILLDIHEKETLTNKSSNKISIKEIQEYQNGTLLNELSKTIDAMEFASLDTFEENNELFLDMAESYRKQGIYTNYLEPIAIVAEELSNGYDPNGIQEKLQRFQTKFIEYEKLFRNYLVAEIYSNTLIPESDTKSMIVMFQWIAMEYTIMKHAILLRWLLDEKEELSYTEIRSIIVIISRMMGFDYEDICEYLENNFRSLQWEWGYLALLIGGL